MNLSLLGTRALGHTEIFMKKHGPTVLTGVGIAGFGAAAVLVGRATLKAKDSAAIKDLRNDIDHVCRPAIAPRTEQERRREAGIATIKLWAEYAKIFAPAIAVGAGSAACILVAHGIMRQQRAALMAAYATLDAGFRSYRKRVEEEFGAEKEQQIYRGIRQVESVDEEGKPCIINEYLDKVNSPYAKFFDPTNKNWTTNPEWNLSFLLGQQQYANNRLQSYGYLFLNQVYEEIGIPLTQAGQEVGWRLDGDGDGFVDFGLHLIGDENSRAFVNCLEPTVLLDFNVDGKILIDD